MINAIMPCRGRTQQTIDLIPRLLSTAGIPEDQWRLTIVNDGDKELDTAWGSFHQRYSIVEYISMPERLGYWQCVSKVYNHAATHIVNLANDLLPGHDWLKLVKETMVNAFPDGRGIVGFNDGIHHGDHVAHFMASTDLLKTWYGDTLVPTCYYHMYGDTEINLRARAERKLAVAHWAVLYHNHPYIGGQGDVVYTEGHARYKDDEELFNYRRTHNWINS